MQHCIQQQKQALIPLSLVNDSIEVQVLPFGAIIKSILFSGQQLILNYQKPEQYLSDNFYLGATIGRYANRINKGQFTLNDVHYNISTNQGEHSLHGGKRGFNQVIWEVLSYQKQRLVLYHLSADGDQGFPGNLQVWQTIELINNSVKISFKANTDKPTVVNLTNHCYFNLNNDSLGIDNHMLQVFSSHYIPTDASIPTGEIRDVTNTIFDLRKPQQLKYLLANKERQLQIAGGLDHCFTFIPDKNSSQLLAKLYSPESELSIKLYSTQPGLQVYSGQHLSSPFAPRQGVCLEAQNWPDSLNRSNFPRSILNPDETYIEEIIYAFRSTDNNCDV